MDVIPVKQGFTISEMFREFKITFSNGNTLELKYFKSDTPEARIRIIPDELPALMVLASTVDLV